MKMFASPARMFSRAPLWLSTSLPLNVAEPGIANSLPHLLDGPVNIDTFVNVIIDAV